MISAHQQHDAELERLVAQRTADLTELLGHLTTEWDDERRLLARTLHDRLGSSMTALTMHLALLGKQLPAEKALQDRAAQMKQLLLHIIEANRQMQLSLWNDQLEFLGVKAALSELVTGFGTRHALDARLSLPDEDAAYSREQNLVLLRCAEEGLDNVAAHSGATEVDLILDDNEEQLMLTVRDNGSGPGRPQQGAAAGHGLRALRERARYLGGELVLASAPERGTLLTLTLPRRRA